MNDKSQTTRTFVCAGCGNVHAILYGARIICSCGTTSAVEVQQPSELSQTTAPGDVTRDRLDQVVIAWRHASAQRAHHLAEAARWGERYEELGKELLSLEDAFPDTEDTESHG